VQPAVEYSVKDLLEELDHQLTGAGEPDLKHSPVESVAAVNTGSTARPMQEVVAGLLRVQDRLTAAVDRAPPLPPALAGAVHLIQAVAVVAVVRPVQVEQVVQA
jgi:hypothetical protein